jgi:hypothetical protein
MSTSNDLRVRELNRLKLALATFALRLNAFEERTHGVLRSIDRSRDDKLPGHRLPGRGSERGGTLASQ